jgi:hypothetical protein
MTASIRGAGVPSMQMAVVDDLELDRSKRCTQSLGDALSPCCAQ